MFLSHTGKPSAQMMVPNGISESTNCKSCQMADLKVQATNHTKRHRWKCKLQFMPKGTGESASYKLYKSRGESANYISCQKAELKVQTTNQVKRQRWECKLQIMPTTEVRVQTTNHTKRWRWARKLQIMSKGRGGSANYESYQQAEVGVQATNHTNVQRWECKLHITPKGRGESANYISCQKAEVRVQATNHAKRQRWEYKLQNMPTAGMRVQATNHTKRRGWWECKLQPGQKAEGCKLGIVPKDSTELKMKLFYCLWYEKLNIFISVGALPSGHRAKATGEQIVISLDRGPWALHKTMEIE